LALALAPWPRTEITGLVAGMVRAGSLVFGGGHVVLPLLREEVVAGSGITESVFLAGYGLAQGMPGPLFNVAAWIGATRAGMGGAALATCAIFLPGALVALGARPLWDRLRALGPFQRALRGVNAAVVGLLALALARHVVPAGIQAPVDLLVAGICLLLLFRTTLPPWLLAASCATWAWLVT
jgi:chromate transporter